MDGRPQSILSLIKQVQYRAYVRLESVFQPMGLTAVQFRILTTLSSRPGLTSADLARLYGVKPQSMVKQVGLLEGKALIGRRASPANRRLLELSLTAHGEAVLAECWAGAESMENSLLAPLDPADQEAMRAMLQALLAGMNAPTVAEDEIEAEEFARLGVQRV